jgi:hypothetical protein
MGRARRGPGDQPRKAAGAGSPSRARRDVSARADLEEEAGCAEVEGSFRRGGRGEDDPDERDRGDRLDGRLGRVAGDLILAGLGRPRHVTRGGRIRAAGAALARRGRGREARASRRHHRRRPRKGRFGHLGRRGAAALRADASEAARPSRALADGLRGGGRRFAYRRKHPHDRREDDRGEPEVMMRCGHGRPGGIARSARKLHDSTFQACRGKVVTPGAAAAQNWSAEITSPPARVER